MPGRLLEIPYTGKLWSSNWERILLLVVISPCIANLISCRNQKTERYPEEYVYLPDSLKIEWLCRELAPDSLAHLVCDSYIGKDSILVDAELKPLVREIYIHLDNDARSDFTMAFNSHVSSMPSADKMKILYLSTTGEGRRAGYVYAIDAIEEKSSLENISSDIEALRNACNTDTLYYRNFTEGFNSAIGNDTSLTRLTY